MDFFLEGVRDTAANAVDTARRLVALFQKDEQRIQALGRAAPSGLRVFQVFKERPILTVRSVEKRTGLSFPAASSSVRRLERLGIVREITGRRRDRVYAYDEYVAILNEGTES